jgi:predicted sugar kinase
MELAEAQELRFGGIGLMLEQPGWQLRFTPAPAGTTRLPPSPTEVEARIAQIVSRAGAAACQVDVIEPLAMHHGLGAGTQLACAVAVGQSLVEQVLDGRSSTAFNGAQDLGEWQPISATLADLEPSRLAELSGRGLRSAIGLVGFIHAGFILDRGYHAGATARSVTAERVDWPEAWRAVLLVPRATQVISGEQEASLLHEIGRFPNPHRPRMLQLATEALDAARNLTDFRSCMQALEDYMFLAGELFKEQQGGLYNGPQVAQAVEQAKQADLRGVGQSSWGPTVFGFAPDQAAAERAAERLRQNAELAAIVITQPATSGAQWRLNSSPRA